MVKKRKNNTLKILAAGAAIYFLFFRGTTKKTRPVPTEENIKEALKRIFNKYGYEKTKRLEQLFRWETRHFKSGQFKGTYSPGMEPAPNYNRVFPYGWRTLRAFADVYGIPYNSFGVNGPYTEGGTGKPKYFVSFPDIYTSMLFVMYVIERRAWNFGKWRAFDAAIALDYNNKLNTVLTPYTNSFI